MAEILEQTPDFRIDRDGRWFHDGDPILRDALTKLFATRALKIDADGLYWLQTPYEKYAVDVADVPFVIIGYEYDGASMVLRGNLGDEVTLHRGSDWRLCDGVPYVEMRDGLMARVSRSVFYQLVDEFGAAFISDGRGFALGEMS